MNSMCPATSSPSGTTSGSAFGSLDEIFDEGEGSCPTFEKLIQRAENENSSLVRLLEEETRKCAALEKEFEGTNSQQDELERSSKKLNEEAKQIQRIVKQNKEISESLKRTNTLLYHHEETLQKKYEKACSELQKLKLENLEVVEKYKKTWDRYSIIYANSKLAVNLTNTKKTAMELQKKASDTKEKVKALETKLISVEKENENIEEKLRHGARSSKTTIINLAELYIHTSNALKLGNEKFHQLQTIQRKEESLENRMQSSILVEENQEEQQLECEIRNAESRKLQREKRQRPPIERFLQEGQKHEIQETGNLTSPSEQISTHQQYHIMQENKTQEIPNRNNVEPDQKSFLPDQDRVIQLDNSQKHLQLQSPISKLSSQQKIINRPYPNSPRPTCTAITTKGLTSYGNLLSSYSQISTPIAFQTLFPSLVRTPQYQLFNKSTKNILHQPQSWMQDSYSKTINQESTSMSQIGVENSNGSSNQTIPMEQTMSSQEYQKQIVEDNPSDSGSTSVKSPGASSNKTCLKTFSKQSDSSELFNFTDYNERLMLMNKSPGEGFSYQSRPMFDTVENMSDDTDNKNDGLHQTSFFPPFSFTSREREPKQQFTEKTTFVMLPQSNQEKMGNEKVQHPFQVEKEQTPLIPDSRNLFSTLTLGGERETFSGAGFSLFSDQHASNIESHGKGSPKAPAFRFNFCTSPSIPAENCTNQSGTFNLF